MSTGGVAPELKAGAEVSWHTLHEISPIDSEVAPQQPYSVLRRGVMAKYARSCACQNFRFYVNPSGAAESRTSLWSVECYRIGS